MIFSVWSSCSSSSRRAVELEQVVVRVGLVADLVGRRADAPVVPADDSPPLRSISVSTSARIFVAPLVVRVGVEQEDQVVDGVLWPCGGAC